MVLFEIGLVIASIFIVLDHTDMFSFFNVV